MGRYDKKLKHVKKIHEQIIKMYLAKGKSTGWDLYAKTELLYVEYNKIRGKRKNIDVKTKEYSYPMILRKVGCMRDEN